MCKFCELLSSTKERVKRYPNLAKHTKYKVALVEKTYRDETEQGRTTHSAMQLNYCPMCGKKL